MLNHCSTFFPHMRGFRAPQRFGEAAMIAIPPDALVLAHWPEFNVLRYRRLVPGDRPDLALQLMTPETLPLRLALWQREHDVARRPFVFMRRIGEMEAHYSGLDSLRLSDGRWIYVQCEPIRGAGNFQEGS